MEHAEIVFALLAHAHCTLKLAYATSGETPTEPIENEIMKLYNLYAVKLGYPGQTDP
jgi:hypothetical protein